MVDFEVGTQTTKLISCRVVDSVVFDVSNCVLDDEVCNDNEA